MMGALRGLGNWAGRTAQRGAGWYSGLGGTAQMSLAGAATGGVTGAFGLNPMNTVPFTGDIDAGGFLGGAAMGAGAGAAFGRFGAGRNLMGRGLVGAGGRLGDLGMGGARGGLGGASGAITGAGARMTHAGYGTFTNKHGDKILASMAGGTAGLIGGSILSTNRPY